MRDSQQFERQHWSIVANVKRELPYGEGGKETRIGTNQFKGGAKVYIVGSYPGMCESLVVIGQNKHSGKFIRSVIRVTAVENLRVKKVYSTSVLKLCSKEVPTGAAMVTTKEEAEYLMNLIPEWCQL